MPTTDAPQSRVSAILEKRIHELAGKRSQKDIARLAGFASPNMITILKQGVAKLALDRVPALAEALEIDPALLFRAALEQQFSPETLDVIRRVMNTTTTENEREILAYIRELTNEGDPALTDKLKDAIKEGL